MNTKLLSREALLSDRSILLSLALLYFIVHQIFAGQYGYFRDEFYYIACSDHLDWGFVDQPPFSIFLLKVSRWILGDSLHAIRFLPAVAGAVSLFLTGLMARTLGGGKFAQVLAALAFFTTPVFLGISRFFSMNAFDILLWVLASYLVIRIVKENNQKLWPIFGIVIGLGLLNKYSIGFFCIGLFFGLLLTSHRKQLLSKWFWLGGAIAFVIVLPHIIWEYSNQFPSLEFMHNASEHKNAPISPKDFALGQIMELGFQNAIIWLPGLFYLFFHKDGKKYRLFGWMYAAIFVLMITRNMKVYYLAPAYPVLMASGAVLLELFIQRIGWKWLKPVIICNTIVGGIITAPFAIPVLPVETFIHYQKFLGLAPKQQERSEVGVLPQHYADMFGWEEMVSVIAQAYYSLTPEEMRQCAIFTNNYGEAGAVDFFGVSYNLPKAISGHNNYWIWGPRGATGEVVIRIGGSLDNLRESYANVVHSGTIKNEYCMPYENNRPVFICKGRRLSTKIDWAKFKHFE